MTTFRKVELSISRGKGYGQYYIHGKYRGKQITVHTTDSECFDWLDDDSNKEKHQEAKRHAYEKIRAAYLVDKELRERHRTGKAFKHFPKPDRFLSEHF